MKKNCNVHQ